MFLHVLITFFPTSCTSRPTVEARAVVKVAVNTEHTVRPIMIHIVQNNRAIIDLGALSPYLDNKNNSYNELVGIRLLLHAIMVALHAIV